LSCVVLPGLDLTHYFRPGLVSDDHIDATLTMAAVLTIPWITGSLLVYGLTWLVPPWRRAVRSPRVAKNLALAAWIAGACVLLSQAFGLSLYLFQGKLVLDETWARWLVCGALVAASFGARTLAALITQRGIGDGMSVLIVGELLLKATEQLRVHGLA